VLTQASISRGDRIGAFLAPCKAHRNPRCERKRARSPRAAGGSAESAILEGTARVEQDGAVVATLEPGDLCGEIGLLLTGRRTAAIVAETPMRMLALFDQTFRRLNSEHPEFAELIRSQSWDRFTRPATV
jgi:hypothetical protein